MGKLSYKPNGMMSLQRTQKVYFCSHPDDFELYFEEISEEILNEKDIDCTIWFHSDPNSDYDDSFWDDLLEMNLFVIPITRKFLCTENNALEVEFRFAIEHHIPVLPLMQDNGLIQIFNDKCGELQFLDKYQFDTTAISYEEKLKKYLHSVLIDDAMIAKIQSAFDAYIFLSYRKIDRKYAQELMKLIHKNDFCRDIAIWYDEFLVPGEDFNHAIQNALTKSDLFVMAVTPNLLEENNYVMAQEYPLAAKNNKLILPIECIPTDKDMLSRKYEYIPECTDANNEHELSRALFNIVKQIAIKEHASSSEHDFFIGLAYLNGIDVEVDFSRAVQLITASAEAGVDAAMEKLVSMYLNGEGVERDYELAIEWKNRLFFALKERYEISQKKEDAIALLHACKELNELYFNYMRWAEEIVFMLEDFSSLTEELAETYSDPIFKHMSALAHYQWGEYWSAEEEDVTDDFLKAYELNLTLVQELGTLETQIALCQCSTRLGDISFEEDNLSMAKNYYQKSLEIAKDIIVGSNTEGTRKNFASCYYRVGKVYQAEEMIPQAKEAYLEAITILQKLAEKSESCEIRKDLMTCYILLAEIELAEEKRDSAKALLEQAYQLSKMIDNISETIQSKEDYANCCEQLHRVYLAEVCEDLAKDYYYEAQLKKGEITEIVGNLEDKEILSVRYYRLGNACVEENRRDLASVFYFRALEVLEYLLNAYEVLSRNYFDACKHRALLVYQKYINLLRQGNEEEKDLAGYYGVKMQKLESMTFEGIGSIL